MNWLIRRFRRVGRRIGQFLMENIEWVILSLSLGFIIWVVAALDENPVQQREFSEPIGVEFIEAADADVVRVQNAVLSNRQVFVTLRAPRSTWERINSDDIRVTANLRGLEPGTHTVELEGEIIDDDLLGRVISVSPDELSVELVEVSERLIQVTPEISRIPSPEYVASSPTCEPQQVTVRGPAPEVSRVASAITRLDLQSVTESTTISSPIVLFNANNRPVINLTTEPETVLCQVDVRQREDAVSVRVVANVVGEPPEGYLLVEDFRVDPPEVLVTADDPEAINAMNGIVMTEPIDVSDQRENFSRNVSVLLPEGVRLFQPTQRVTVSISINEQNITRTFTEVPVQVQNLDIGLNVSLMPETVSVDVTGPQSIISGLTVEDISVTVDLAGRGEGRHENLRLRSSLLRESLQDADIRVNVQPQTVTAEITPDVQPSPTPSREIFGKSRP